MLLFGNFFLRLFISGTPEEIDTSMQIAYHYLAIMSVCLPILYMLHIYRSALMGRGDTVVPMLSGFAEMAVRIAVALFLPMLMGQEGIFCRGGSLDGRGHRLERHILCGFTGFPQENGIGRCFPFPAAGKEESSAGGMPPREAKGKKKRIQRQTEVYKMKKGARGQARFFVNLCGPACVDRAMAGQKLKENSITEGVIWKQLLSLFLSYSDRDIFSAALQHGGHRDCGAVCGQAGPAAVGTTREPSSTCWWDFFVGVSSGATVIISQFFGAGDGKNVSRAVHTSMALALAGGGIIMVVGLLTSRLSLEMLGCRRKL